MQVREKVEKSRNTDCVSRMFCGSGGSKSRLARAAGAEPSGKMRDEKLHAVVARSTSPSQNVKSTSCTEHYNYNYNSNYITLHYTTPHYTTPHHATLHPHLHLHLRLQLQLQLQLQLFLHYTTLGFNYTTLHYNYNSNYTILHQTTTARRHTTNTTTTTLDYNYSTPRCTTLH